MGREGDLKDPIKVLSEDGVLPGSTQGDRVRPENQGSVAPYPGRCTDRVSPTQVVPRSELPWGRLLGTGEEYPGRTGRRREVVTHGEPVVGAERDL